jgi:hypothetical protein
MVDTPYLGLPNISSGQSDKSVTHNDALQLIDALLQRGVVDKDLTAPPGSPTDGSAYIVGASATGAWSGHDGKIAYYWSGWQLFITPWEGLTVWVNDEDSHYVYDGSAWVAITGDPSALKANVSANLTVGYTATGYSAGTKSSGTFTPVPANGGLQYYTNGGAHTLTPPSTGSGDSVSMVLQITNNSSAGAITTSGFTVLTGDSLTTTDGDDFLCYVTVLNGFSHLHVIALQ